jgi:flotillin
VEQLLSIPIIAGTILALIVSITLIVALKWRTVVPTNVVHVVQSGKATVSYGRGLPAGNVYYHWPSWLPKIGLTVMVIPVNNFALPLTGYEAYDKDRVPFTLDVTAFFRVCDTNQAAERISSFEDLKRQLEASLQGAIRKILASHDIHMIMTDRATFGAAFTTEVKDDLKSWGVEPVKSIEHMDIRDTQQSHVIADIMKKKSSEIESDSRMKVAENNRNAVIAEIEAKQLTDVRAQESQEAVGKRTAEKEAVIGIASQESQQRVAEAQAETTKKQITVKQVEDVGKAEIAKQTAVIAADQNKAGQVKSAEGALEAAKLNAEGVRAEGEARAAAEQAMQMAPVQAQIALAKEIGENKGYQQYLIGLKHIEATLTIGTAQAAALSSAEVKIIATAGNAGEGLSGAGQIFTPNSGLAIGSLLEGLSNTDQGKQLLKGIADMMSNMGNIGKATVPVSPAPKTLAAEGEEKK